MSIDHNIKRALFERDYRLIEPIIHVIGWIGIIGHITFYLLCASLFFVADSLVGRISCVLAFFGFLFLPKSNWNRFHKTYFELVMVFTIFTFFSYLFLQEETSFWFLSLAFGALIAGMFIKPVPLLLLYFPAILLTAILYDLHHGLTSSDIKMMLEGQSLIFLTITLALALQVAFVTTKYRLEEATRRAELANQAKSLFLANVSHEIRTPMAAILGYTELLIESRKKIITIDKETATEYLQTIHRNAEHLLAILNDILDISKIEAEKASLEILPCSLFNLAKDCQTLMESRAKEKGLKFDIHFDSPMPKTIATDPTRFRQVLFNLVSNAIKFTNSGKIDIRFRLVNHKSKLPRLECQVHDTGPGMSPEAIKKIFEPFSQADNSITREFGGTGLGLTISKRIASLLGGDLTVQSQLGQGSIFYFTSNIGCLDGITIFSEEEAKRRYSLTTSKEHQIQPLTSIQLQGHILLVEDAFDNQRLIKTILEKIGLTVELAENGVEGRDKALAAHRKGKPYDLILMDIQMPILDGYEATRQLRANGYKGPIIALTASTMTDDRKQCRDAGCDSHLAKPIQRKELLRALSHHLSTSQKSVPSS